MANIMKFKAGDTIIGQGDEDTVAYLIKSGWLEVSRNGPDKKPQVFSLQAGEVVGELGLAGLSQQRTATVTALTDGEVEVIDRGALIRLVNGPASRLTPLLAALFSRLKLALAEPEEVVVSSEHIVYAKLIGMNGVAKQTLCNQVSVISYLPWIFGAFRPPQTVTDLFSEPKHIDVKLTGCSQFIREQHMQIEQADEGGLQLRVIQHGDFCLLDDQRIGHRKDMMLMPLSKGKHTLNFGDQSNPFIFQVDIL